MLKGIEMLKNIIPTVVLLCGLYYTIEGRLNVIELRLNAKKIRIEKLESQSEINIKTFQDLTRSIDKLNFHFENQEKRLVKAETK